MTTKGRQMDISAIKQEFEGFLTNSDRIEDILFKTAVINDIVEEYRNGTVCGEGQSGIFQAYTLFKRVPIESLGVSMDENKGKFQVPLFEEKIRFMFSVSKVVSTAYGEGGSVVDFDSLQRSLLEALKS